MSTNTERTLIIAQGTQGKMVLLRLTIPNTAKVTFGPLFPGKPGSYSNSDSLYLRIYKTQSEQLACIPNVIWFRDEALTAEELRIDENNKVGWAEIKAEDFIYAEAERQLGPKEDN